MAQVRTLEELQTALDKEMAWRIKEVSVFKFASRSDDGPKSKTFIRAGVALLYAHWEGFIKRSSELYLSHVESSAVCYRDLKSCFIVFGLKGKINTLIESKQAAPNIEAIDFIISKMDEKPKLQIKAAINTEANLPYRVFSNIAKSLGIDTARYETKNKLIDISLVDRRNKIAHGNYIEIEGENFEDLTDDILGIMRAYKTDIETAASNESYRNATSSSFSFARSRT